MDIKKVLKTLGSKDVEADLKLVNQMSSEKIRGRLSMLAKTVSKRYDTKLDLVLGGGSYCGPLKSGGLHIVIDPLQAFEPGITRERYYLKLTGIVGHEAGHILFTDFEEVAKVNKTYLTAQKSIPLIAKDVEKSEIEIPVSEKNIELLNAIRTYMFYKNMVTMQNSLEDAAVEHMVPMDNPRVYGGIVAIRNDMVKKEEEFLKKHFLNYKTEDKNILDYFMTEMRHMATIGYRVDKTSTQYLEDIFDCKEIEEIWYICLYARISTKNTGERTALSELLLSKFDDYFNKKSLKFYQEYMTTLNMSPEDLLNSMDMEMDGHKEMSIAGQLDPSLAGATKPQNITNDYQLDIPQDVQEKIDNKLKEKQEANEDASSGSDNSSSESSGSESGNSESGESSDSKSDEKSNDGDNSDSSSGDDKSDKDGKSDESGKDGESGKGDEADKDENGKGKDGKEGEEGKDGEEGKGTDNDSSSASSQLTKNSESGTSSSLDKRKIDKKAAATEAETAQKNALKKYKDSFEKEEVQTFKQSVHEGNGKAPSLDNNLGDISSISDMHKGVRTNYYPSKTFTEMSSTGRTVLRMESDLKKISNTFSKKLKEVLMYRAKCRRKTALKRGNINDADLFRIITDTRVFKDTTPGIINKARICVLIDLSGSMYGEKEEDAVAASYMLADACQRINVPISVLGHNTSGNACSVYHFIEYENCFKKDAKEKLLSAQASSSNHDSIAIFHSLTDLVRHRRPNEQLIFIVISDGAPAGLNGYYGDVADEDIRNIYKSFEKNFNTKTIGVGIGSDVEHIPNIYDDYLLVSNVSQLGNELLKILKSTLL